MPAQTHYVRTRAKTMQQVLDMAISFGYYNPYHIAHYHWERDIPLHTDGHRVAYMMCNALTFMERDLIITELERLFAVLEINDYLESSYIYPSSCTLKHTLANHGLPCEPIDLINIYRNWDSKPPLHIRY